MEKDFDSGAAQTHQTFQGVPTHLGAVDATLAWTILFTVIRKVIKFSRYYPYTFPHHLLLA